MTDSVSIYKDVYRLEKKPWATEPGGLLAVVTQAPVDPGGMKSAAKAIKALRAYAQEHFLEISNVKLFHSAPLVEHPLLDRHVWTAEYRAPTVGTRGLIEWRSERA